MSRLLTTVTAVRLHYVVTRHEHAEVGKSQHSTQYGDLAPTKHGARPDPLAVLAAGRRAAHGQAVSRAGIGQLLAAWFSLLRPCTALPHHLAMARPHARQASRSAR